MGEPTSERNTNPKRPNGEKTIAKVISETGGAGMAINEVIEAIKTGKNIVNPKLRIKKI